MNAKSCTAEDTVTGHPRIPKAEKAKVQTHRVQRFCPDGPQVHKYRSTECSACDKRAISHSPCSTAWTNSTVVKLSRGGGCELGERPIRGTAYHRPIRWRCHLPTTCTCDSVSAPHRQSRLHSRELIQPRLLRRLMTATQNSADEPTALSGLSALTKTKQTFRKLDLLVRRRTTCKSDQSPN